MSDQVLRGTSATLAAAFYADEAPVAADGAVTVTITRPDGTALVTNAATVHTGDAYTYVLAPQATLSILTCAWSGTFSGQAQTITIVVEIVGGYLFALRQLRSMPGCSDTTRFTTADLEAARARASDYVEQRVGAALVYRYGTETISRSSRRSDWTIPVRSFVRTLLSLSVEGIAFSATALADIDIEEWGALSRHNRSYFPFGRVTVAYEHGYSATPPPELAQAALIRARHDLLGWTSDQPSHSIDVAELGATDPAAANADMMAGRTQVADAIKTWRGIITGLVIA